MGSVLNLWATPIQIYNLTLIQKFDPQIWRITNIEILNQASSQSCHEHQQSFTILDREDFWFC
jgi:hypothetical protein